MFNKFFKITATLSLTSSLLLACSPKAAHQVETLEQSNGVIDGAPVEVTDSLATSTVFLQVVILNEQNKPAGAFGCTGTLIAPNLVVTAAHCVPDKETKNFRFAIGFNRNLEAIQPSEVRAVKKFIPHSGYGQEGANGNTSDIALISFEGSIPKGFAPAKVLVDSSKLKENAPVTVSGYGLIKWERGQDANTVENNDIKESSTILRKGPAIFLGFMNENEAVLDQSQNKKGGGACSGDSGGPATVVLDQVEYVWGVASRVANPDDHTKPCNGFSIYTSISTHAEFLSTASRQLLEDLNGAR